MPKVSQKCYRKAKKQTDLDFSLVENSNNDISCDTYCNNNESSSGFMPVQPNHECVGETEFNEDNSVDEFGKNYLFSDNELDDSWYVPDDSDSQMQNDVNEGNSEPLILDESSSYPLSTLLLQWSIQHKISQSAFTDLLKILKPHFPDMPSDSRTLLKTPKNTSTKPVHPGHYFHFGFANCITKLLSKFKCHENLDCIEVCINIDGLPLSKSSGSQLYPILYNLFQNRNTVDIIGLYQGHEKPKEANVFLKDFIDEARNLINTGFAYKNRIYPVKIKCIICDVPGKTFITYTKGHAGYNSCSKCRTVGDFDNNRVFFPQTENIQLRSDHDFRLKVDEDHHTGTSLLELLPNFDMVKDIPLDYMHLICLGVMRKLILLWISGKPPAKLSFRDVSSLSEKLIILVKCTPCEFVRKPRSLSEVRRWKATEFRLFLFYIGPVVLKNVLKPDFYLNFLSLHVAVTIVNLSNPSREQIQYAQSLFEYFVKTFITLYGKANVSHNIHNLIHICDDVERFGCLDNFSAFPFENYMQILKKYVRKPEKPLEQIIRRKIEEEKIFFLNLNSKIEELQAQLKYEHTEVPLLFDTQFATQYKEMHFNHFKLKIREPDNCCCLKDNSIILIENFCLTSNNIIMVVGRKFEILEEFYNKPFSSENLGIYLVSELGSLQAWNVNDIAFKYVKLDFQNNFLVIPLLHTNSQ